MTEQHKSLKTTIMLQAKIFLVITIRQNDFSKPNIIPSNLLILHIKLNHNADLARQIRTTKNRMVVFTITLNTNFHESSFINGWLERSLSEADETVALVERICLSRQRREDFN